MYRMNDLWEMKGRMEIHNLLQFRVSCSRDGRRERKARTPLMEAQCQERMRLTPPAGQPLAASTLAIFVLIDTD